jgi:hypothetical protein
MAEKGVLMNWHRDAPSVPVIPYNDFISNQLR